MRKDILARIVITALLIPFVSLADNIIPTLNPWYISSTSTITTRTPSSTVQIPSLATTSSNNFITTNASGTLQLSPSGGGSTINGQSGPFTLQGTINQVNVSTSGGTTTFSTPQDISTTSSVLFSNLTAASSTVTGTSTVDNVQARTSAGFDIHANNGSQVALFGAGGGTGSTLYGGLNVNGVSTLATTSVTQFTIDALTGILAGLNGLVRAINISSPLSYSTTTNNLSISTSTTSTDGFLTSIDWNTFNGKLSTTTASSTYVPYNGANSSVDLNNKSLTNISNLSVNNYADIVATTTTQIPSAGTVRIFGSTTQGNTRPMYMDDDGISITLGRDNFIIAKNVSGVTIATSSAVYITGSTGNVPTIDLAIATTTTKLPSIGLAMQSISNNSFGYIMHTGILSNVNTSAFSSGDRLFVSTTTAGGLTNSRPTYPNIVQRMGSVLVSGVGNGSIEVVTAPFEGGRETGTISSSFNIGGSNALTVNGITASSSIGISTSSTSVNIGAKNYPIQWIIENPTASENDGIFVFNSTSTIRKVTAVNKSLGDTITFGLGYSSSRSTATSSLSNLFTSAQTVTATTTPVTLSITGSSTPSTLNPLIFWTTAASSSQFTLSAFYDEQ